MDTVEDIFSVMRIISHSQIQLFITLTTLLNNYRRIERQSTYARHCIRQLTFFRLIYESDLACRESTRMDRRTFTILCNMLRSTGYLEPIRCMDVKGMVVIFLHILAHDVKNQVVHRNFSRFGETVSRYFDAVLRAVLQLHTVLLRKPEPITNTCTDGRWKWFQNCLGALDGTYIKVNVSVVDRPRYRRKGEIATNVLVVCDQNGEFVFVLPGWERSAIRSRVLRNAVSRPYGLRVPKGYYYLCDAGYPNAEGFLAPYRGERYHLPGMVGKFFNMNIEQAFGLLKGRWAILRGKSFYPIQVQCRTITACCLIHNLITREMGIGAMLDVPDEENSASVGLGRDHIEFVESLEEWTKFRDDLAVEMFTQWQRA